MAGRRENVIASSCLEELIFKLLLITLFIMPFSITANEVFMGLTILFWLIKLFSREKKVKVPALGWFFLIFLLAAFLSAMASDYKTQAFRGVWDIIRYTIIFFIVLDIIKTIEEAQKVFWVLVLSTTLWAISGIIHQFLIIKRDLFTILNFFALGNKNAIGQYLQMMLSIMLGIFLNYSLSPREKKLLIASILISLLALFLSSSKTMWVAFVITLAVFAFLRRSEKVIWGVGGFIAVIIIVAIFSAPVKEIGSHIIKGFAAPSMQERYIGWKQSLNMFLDNPIFGVGPKCFFPSKDKYQVLQSFGQAHNLFLQVACEMGIVGIVALILWVSFYFLFIINYRQKVKEPFYLGLWYGGVGYIITLAIGGITEPTIGGEHSQLFMALAGLLQLGVNKEEKIADNVLKKIKN